MGILSIFRPLKKSTSQSWEELGQYNARFTNFGSDMFASDTIRACIRPLAEFTSKAEAKSSDPQIARLLNNRPNIYMSGRDFLYKVRTMLELKNTVFIYIQRDPLNLKVLGFYPVPYQSFEALEYSNNLYIRFQFASAAKELTLPWQDLAVIRKDYNKSDIAGDNNSAILDSLDLQRTLNEGTANAIRSTANLRGIIKSTKAMLSDEDVKKQKDRFVKDYLSLDNEGGVASLDATQEFIPINMSPKVADHEQMREARENIYRYFGVNDKVVMSEMNSDEIEAFYELRIEPFLVALSRELTSKIYSQKELAMKDGQQNWVVYEANKLQFASLNKKIQLFKEVVLYGGMTVNEWRLGSNMAPLEGGDELIRRLDAAPVSEEGDESDE